MLVAVGGAGNRRPARRRHARPRGARRARAARPRVAHVFSRRPGSRPLRLALPLRSSSDLSAHLPSRSLESYLHWRAGLGWHGLHCLAGPVHRDAVPIVAALSLVAVALFACRASTSSSGHAGRSLGSSHAIRSATEREHARGRHRRSWLRAELVWARALPARGPPVRSLLSLHGAAACRTSERKETDGMNEHDCGQAPRCRSARSRGGARGRAPPPRRTPMSPPVALAEARARSSPSLCRPRRRTLTTTKIELTPPDGLLDRLVRALARLEADGRADRLRRGGRRSRRSPGRAASVPTGEDASSSSSAAPTRARRTRSTSGRPTRTARSSTGRGRRAPTRRRRRRGEELARRRWRQLELSIVALVVGALGLVRRHRRARHPLREAGARMSRRGRTVTTLLALAVAALALPASAWAHAALLRTVPSASGTVNRPPAQVVAHLQRSGRAALRDRLGHRRERHAARPPRRRAGRPRTRTRSSCRSSDCARAGTSSTGGSSPSTAIRSAAPSRSRSDRTRARRRSS